MSTVETLRGHDQELPPLFKSLHTIAELKQELIGSL